MATVAAIKKNAAAMRVDVRILHARRCTTLASKMEGIAAAAQRLGAELRSHDDSMLDPIPTEVTKHCKAPTDGVSSSDMLGGSCASEAEMRSTN